MASTFAEEEELMDALRKTIDGFERYGYRKKWIAMNMGPLIGQLTRRGELLEAISVNQRLIKVLRELLEEHSTEDNSIASEEPKDHPIIRLFLALRSLSKFHSIEFQTAAALRSVDEVVDLMPELRRLNFLDPDTEIKILAFKTQALYSANVGGCRPYILKAWGTVRDSIEVYARENGCTTNEVLYKSEKICQNWFRTVILMDATFTDSEWKQAFPNAETRKEILTKAISVVIPKPEDANTISNEAHRARAEQYRIALTSLSPRKDSHWDQVESLEKAFDILVTISTPDILKAPKPLTYAEVVDIADWRAFDRSLGGNTCSVLPKLGNARLSLLLQLEEVLDNPEPSKAITHYYEDCIGLLAKEVEFGLTEKISQSSQTEEIRKAFETARGQILVLKGRMNARLARRDRKEENEKNARECWEDARWVLKSVEDIQTNGLDKSEKERLEELAIVEALLEGRRKF